MRPTLGQGGSSALAIALRRAWHRSLGSLSLTLVFVCVGIFLLATLLNLFGLVTRHRFVALFGLSYEGLFHRLWLHQVLTAWFIHANVTHLLFNMLSLWMLGPSVEAAIGRTRYIRLTLASIGCATLGTLLLNWGTDSVVAGYTSVIFGILVAQALLFPNNILVVMYFFPMKMKHAAILLAAVALYFAVSAEPGGPAHAAHVFGAAGAFLYLRGQRQVGAVRSLQALWMKLKARAARAKDARQRRRRRTETPWKL